MMKKIVTFLILMSLVIAIAPFSKSNAETNSSVINQSSQCQSNNEKAVKNNLDQQYQLYNELSKYLVKDANGLYFFNKELAKKENMTDFNILTGQQLATIKNDEILHGEKEVYNKTVEQKTEMNNQVNRSFAFTMWNYCGPGNHGGTPKNGIDKICKVHDDCYTKKGWGSCACDKAIADSMGYAAANSKYTAFQRSFAAAAAAHFTQRYYTRVCRWW